MEKVTVPEGESNGWKVERFEISENQAMIAMLRDGIRAPRPGTYTRLTHGCDTVMSDTPAEMRDHRMPVRMAHGNILIHGLGLGMVLQACMAKYSVTKATVIEKSEDVISLVAPHYENMFGDRVEIIKGDAMTWKSPKGIRYGMVWHDIWTHICQDNYEQMKTLHRRYGRKCDWQGSWSRGILSRRR